MNNDGLVTIKKPNSYISECYKMFRTNLNYINIDGKYKIFMTTSATVGEGKSTSTCNLAISLAQVGKKVLLIDCDLRCANIHNIFGLKQTPGLTGLLSTNMLLSEVVQQPMEIKGLDILCAGLKPPAPAELLGSEKFKNLINTASNIYDIILLDAPPVLYVTDASIISQLVDGVILVVAANKTKKSVVVNAKKALDKVGANIVGVTITKMTIKQKGKYYGEKGKNIIKTK
ncbi:MAG: capsular biosynthesis protein [Firmicutes bacterium HGW-Firmicutes-1]|jgi:capsular exopolysaccharide synthesis family protein|nr:MAG: capsular biosynthesis protein [Firmicutes bacterium HGW-Firmicutes-1]